MTNTRITEEQTKEIAVALADYIHDVTGVDALGSANSFIKRLHAILQPEVEPWPLQKQLHVVFVDGEYYFGEPSKYRDDAECIRDTFTIEWSGKNTARIVSGNGEVM